MTQNRAAIYLTAWEFAVCSIWGVGAVVLTALASKNKWFPDIYAYLAFLLLVLASAHALLYFTGRFYLKKKADSGQVTLLDRGNAVSFTGNDAFLRLYLGFAWRTFVVGFIESAVSKRLFEAFRITSPGVAASVIHIFGSLAIFYFATLWIIKSPYGKVRLSFDKKA